MARVVMEQVGGRSAPSIVIENRPGAGGTIGAMQFEMAPDGYDSLRRAVD